MDKNKADVSEIVDGQRILEEADREFRYRQLEGVWSTIVVIISCIFVCYHIITSRFGMPEMFKHRALHLGFILILVWLYYPAVKKSPKNCPSIVDLILVVFTISTIGYIYLNVDSLALRAGVAVPSDYVFGAICILLLLEACRRVVGVQLLVLVLVFLFYAWAGRYVPGVLAHRGYSIKRIIYQMYLTTQGIFGIPLGVSATYMIIFVVLAAMLGESGLGSLFNDVALSVAGRTVGGPAKVSVIASALCGMISGGAATNVATTGAFTIPLMKSCGYKPYFAGAVEAAASTGGQLMPPIMGTVAFIMAEFLGVPYLRVAAAAIIPSILFFAGVFVQVDLRSRKRGLMGLPSDEIPDAKAAIRRYGHMVIPVFVLVYLMIKQRTAIYAAFYTVVLTWALSLLREETRLVPSRLVSMAVEAARSCLSVGVAMANAGFVVGVLSMTGIGLIIADNIVALSHGKLFIALFLTMIVSIILGMGLPTSACYIIASSIAVPILTKLDVPAFQAHFFVLYYACLSTITPPVALASFVGAGMAGANPNQVGWTAFRLALAAFIIPFFFVYSPEMLLISDGVLAVVVATATGLVGTAFLSVACEGFLYVELPIWLRIIFLVAAVLLIKPGITTDLIGLALAGLAFIIIKFIQNKANTLEKYQG